MLVRGGQMKRGVFVQVSIDILGFSILLIQACSVIFLSKSESGKEILKAMRGAKIELPVGHLEKPPTLNSYMLSRCLVSKVVRL